MVCSGLWFLMVYNAGWIPYVLDPNCFYIWIFITHLCKITILKIGAKYAMQPTMMLNISIPPVRSYIPTGTSLQFMVMGRSNTTTSWFNLRKQAGNLTSLIARHSGMYCHTVIWLFLQWWFRSDGGRGGEYHNPALSHRFCHMRLLPINSRGLRYRRRTMKTDGRLAILSFYWRWLHSLTMLLNNQTNSVEVIFCKIPDIFLLVQGGWGNLFLNMMTSWQGEMFRITSPLFRLRLDFPHKWPVIQSFPLSLTWASCWVNGWVAGALWRLGDHVTLMLWHITIIFISQTQDL